MAQSFCKMYLHIIFHSKAVSPPAMNEHLCHLANTTGCQVLITRRTSDRVHTLLLLSSTENVAHWVEQMKRDSSRWMKSFSSHDGEFAWQSSYAAFSLFLQDIIYPMMTAMSNQMRNAFALTGRVTREPLYPGRCPGLTAHCPYRVLNNVYSYIRNLSYVLLWLFMVNYSQNRILLRICVFV